MPSKRIIIIDTSNPLRVALWVDVPKGQESYYKMRLTEKNYEHVKAEKLAGNYSTSEVRDESVNPVLKSVWPGASGAENADIASGKVVERVVTFNLSSEPYSNLLSNTGNVSRLYPNLEEAWTNFQNEVSTDKKNEYFGTYWDGTGSNWTQVNKPVVKPVIGSSDSRTTHGVGSEDNRAPYGAKSTDINAPHGVGLTDHIKTPDIGWVDDKTPHVVNPTHVNPTHVVPTKS